jgi:hypothetical protein
MTILGRFIQTINYLLFAGIVTLLVLSVLNGEQSVTYILYSIGLLACIVLVLSVFGFVENRTYRVGSYINLFSGIRQLIHVVLATLGLISLLAHLAAWIITSNSQHGWAALTMVGFIVSVIVANILVRLVRAMPGIDYL